MRPEGPTHWLLDGRLGWRIGSAQAVVASALELVLTALPDGPLSLASDDGSLGGLVLPRGMALDASGLTYLLSTESLSILRFEPEAGQFRCLPTIGGEGAEARQFSASTQSIAIVGHDLFVADGGNGRLLSFSLVSLALRAVWLLAGGTAEEEQAWDVAASGDHVALLMPDSRRVFIRRGQGEPQEVIVDGLEQGTWSRVALDQEKRMYLLNRDEGYLDAFDVVGGRAVWRNRYTDPGQLRGRFQAPPLQLDHQGRFCLPRGLTVECGRELPNGPPSGPCTNGSLLFSRAGERIAWSTDPEPVGPRSFAGVGVYVSEALDSQIYDCAWHRIDLDFAALPVGTKVTLRAHTSNDLRSADDIRNLPGHLWHSKYVWVGSDTWQAPESGCDVLVDGPLGQYLWVRLDFDSDGYASPAMRGVRVHYPRESYMAHLPAVYSQDAEAKAFLERFLALFQTEWDAVEENIGTFFRHLDVRTTPDEWIRYLASWFALPLEGEWSGAQQRQLLATALRHYPMRGSRDALRAHIRAYLHALTSISPEQTSPHPLLIESYRKRFYLMTCSRADGRRPLWSQAAVGRMQLDVYSQTGRAQLVSPGSSEQELFDSHAHRFEVFVPSSWVRSRKDERLLRRAIEAEKPAHTSYDLHLVEPRLRVGVQSTVGLDTIIGTLPRAQLACAAMDDVAPSRAPRNRLGYDMVLSKPMTPPVGGSLNPGVRIGHQTLLD